MSARDDASLLDLLTELHVFVVGCVALYFLEHDPAPQQREVSDAQDIVSELASAATEFAAQIAGILAELR